MADPKRQHGQEEALMELAEALALGEAVPRHLTPLWKQAGRDPEAMARLEELRDWWLAVREASQQAEAPEALLVLAVERGALPRMRVLRMEGWLRRKLAVDAEGRTHEQAFTEGVLRAGGLEILAARRGSSLSFRIAGARGQNAIAEIAVYDADGVLLDRTTALPEEPAGLETAEAGRLRVVVTWRSAPTADAKIAEI